MRRTVLLLVLLATIAALVPGPSLAQSAGDEQYVDPFQGQGQQGGEQSGSGGGGGGQTSGGDSQAVQPNAGTGTTDDAGGTIEAAPPASTTAGGDGSAAAGSGSPTLPATGAAPLATLVLGAALVAGGAALRRRG
jgi:LPXTG-motif cell wall-anchored protein